VVWPGLADLDRWAGKLRLSIIVMSGEPRLLGLPGAASEVRNFILTGHLHKVSLKLEKMVEARRNGI
jgi:hypothetical protein